jgi:hypothetical protein
MYNPENLELPEYLDDPRLKTYTWRYDLVVGQVFASEGNGFVPEMHLDVDVVGTSATSFEIMYGLEDIEHVTEAERIFEIERLNPSDERFSETSKEVLEVLGFETSDKATPSLTSWYEEVTRENCGFLAVKRLRISMLWELRGWPGLTLERVKSEIFGSGSELKFESNWDLHYSDGRSVLIHNVDISTQRENESLELFDSDKFVNRVSDKLEFFGSWLSYWFSFETLSRLVSSSFLKKAWDKLEIFASRFSFKELRSSRQVEADEEDEQQETIESFALTCIFPNHMEIGFVPETYEYINLCDKCDYPLIPKILMDVLTSGQMPTREPNRTEAILSLFASVMIYWAQYNLDVKSFYVAGPADDEIRPSPLVTEEGLDDRQVSLGETLYALSSFGNADFGSFEDYGLRKFLIFCNASFYWDVNESESSGAQEMILGVRQAFALLNDTNFEAFNNFVETVQSTFSHMGPLVSFFRKGLQETQQSRRIFSPVKVKARFELRAEIWTDGGLEPTDEDDRVLVENDPSEFLSARLRETHLKASKAIQAIAALDYQFEGLSKRWVDYWNDDYLAMRYECSLEFHAVIASTAADKNESIEPSELLNTFVAVIESPWRDLFIGKPGVANEGESIFWSEGNEWICGNKFDEVMEDSSEVPEELRKRPVFELEVENISRNSEWFRGTPWTM